LMTKDASDPNLWSIEIDLIDGGAQFTANDGDLTWGASGFPTDTAVLDGDTIPVVAGRYVVDFNASTGVYTFTEVIIYDSVGIYGTATSVGFESDIKMEQSADDPSEWSLRLDLLDGEALFRGNNDPAISWGGGEFPSGTATLGGATIPVTAGDYIVKFNSFTGAYTFTEVVEYDAISLVGRSGPFGDWPGDDASRDLFLDKDPADPNHWTTTNVTLTDYSLADDGGVKFRADTAWTINWGAEAFPTGTGTQDGPNIQCTAGTFNVDFNSATGEYAFIDPATSSRDFLKASEIKLYPNPTTELINIDLSAVELKGEVQLSVFDLSGKMVMSQRKPVNSVLQLNVNQLKAGNYLLQILNEKVIVGKQFAIAK
ncbi:MAG: T9SS type A sorting domain-containing protein, partial [Saprospiraceae bacterium]|nr:T9SS type A sorting domain-containing protein [Saprospiraceae bacterium]